MAAVKRIAIAVVAFVAALAMLNAWLASASAGENVTVVESKAQSSAKISTKVRHVGKYVGVARVKLKWRGRKGCFWARGTWTNTTNSSGIKRYKETSRARFCPLKKPMRVGGVIYRHLKVAGGLTGSPCMNPAIPPRRPQPRPQLTGFVLDVKSLANVRITVKVNANAKAQVSAQKVCADGAVLSGSASGTASASGRMAVRISARALIKSKGKINGTVKAEIRQKISASLKAQARADALARISFQCGGGVIPPPPPPVKDRAPQVSHVLPAHLYVGGNAYVWVEAHDPDGDPISINVIGSGAGWVSGIIPVSIRWDGSPCPTLKQCFRATAWAGSSAGTFTVVTTATAGGKSSSISGSFPVMKDDFGGW